ncbi:hypothetical protein ABPG77_005750 [Micractinium sp. CCAP 211/92]
MVSKELYNLWLHVDPTYDTRRIEGASTEGQLQHKSRVLCPAIKHVSTTGEEVLLAEFTCEGQGRSKKDAEQDAASAALQHIYSVAPALAVVVPHRQGSTADEPAAMAEAEPAGPEGHGAEHATSDASELREMLCRAVQREERLVQVLRSIRRAIDDALDNSDSP